MTTPSCPNTLTDPARRRCRQRGIRRPVVETILWAGDRHCHVGDGAVALWLSRRSARELVAEGIPAAVLEKTQGVILVLSEDDGSVRTALHDRGGTRGRAYRHERRGPCRVRPRRQNGATARGLRRG